MVKGSLRLQRCTFACCCWPPVRSFNRFASPIPPPTLWMPRGYVVIQTSGRVCKTLSCWVINPVIVAKDVRSISSVSFGENKTKNIFLQKTVMNDRNKKCVSPEPRELLTFMCLPRYLPEPSSTSFNSMMWRKIFSARYGSCHHAELTLKQSQLKRAHDAHVDAAEIAYL